MNLQNNTNMVKSYSAYKLYYKFIGILAIFLIALTLAEIVINENYLYFLVAIIGYLFFIISSTPLFLIWHLAKNNEKVLFFSSYITWMIIIPALWLGIIYIILFLYSFVMMRCCENNQFLHVDVWYSLTHIYEKLTPQLFAGLFVYISLWLSMNIKKSKVLNITAKGLTIMSFIFFLFSTVVNFGI